MAALPDPTIDAIYESYEKDAEGHRGYLGGSEIGEECRRMLWYRFRQVRQPSFSGRILRLFETGHREEERIIENLRTVGVEVLDKDPETGEQWEFVACGGHSKTHPDGVLLGLLEAPKTWHLLECKTANAKNFAQIQKHECKKAKPVHWAQIQIGMGLAELTRAAYIVCLKDTDDLHLERIHFDKAAFDALLRKASNIIYAEGPPDRIGKDSSFYKCKFCDFKDYCREPNVFPDVNCRTCAHGTPILDGQWSCARGFDVAKGCTEHIFLPSLLHWASPIDGDPTHVKYRVGDYEFVNCAPNGFGDDCDHFSSEELRAG